MQVQNNINQQLIELHKRATMQFDASAAIELDDLIKAKNIYSNKNNRLLMEALKACASKQSKECRIRLINQYDRLIKKEMSNQEINYHKVKDLIKHCVKWCEITSKDNHLDYSAKIQELMKIANKNIDSNDKANPLYWKIRKINKINLILSIFFIVIFLLFIILTIAAKQPLFVIGCIVPILFLIYLILYYTYFKKKYFNSEERIKETLSYTPNTNINIIERDKTIGFLGEEYVNQLINNHREVTRHWFINIFNDQLQKKFNFQITYDTKWDWVNKENESTSPFDFVVSKEGLKKIFIEVKTSTRFIDAFHLSYKESEFIKSIDKENSIYIILLLKGFKYKKKEQFADKNFNNLKPRLVFINALDENELSKFTIKAQTKEEFENKKSQFSK